MPHEIPPPRDSDWLTPLIPFLRESGTRIVEIGCGWGLDAATLGNAGFEVFAFDRAGVDRARRLALRAALFHADHKRFFDEPAVRAALEGCFAIEHLQHTTVHRYEQPKQAWECLARAI